MTMGLLALGWLLAGTYNVCGQVDTNWTSLQPYSQTNSPSATNAPVPGGGNGWVPVPAGGITLAPSESILFAFLNTEDATRHKYLHIEIDTTLVADITCLSPAVPKPGGFNGNGTGVKGYYKGGGFRAGAQANRRYDDIYFETQPAWERMSYQNTCNHPITIARVRAWSACALIKPSFNSLLLAQNLGFGANAPGAMATNQMIRSIFVFPTAIAVNLGVTPTFSAPGGTGNWTNHPATMDPDGNVHPLGGIMFVTDGVGLAPGQQCNFSFTMQGPHADLHYTMYAFDSVSAEFQSYNLDLTVPLNAQLIGGGIIQISWPAGETGLQLQTTPNLASPSWTPVGATIVGDQYVATQPVTVGPQFYRLTGP
jgi:hypothetical protein